MKLSLLLMLVCTLQLSASVSLGQQVSVQFGESSLGTILENLNHQTGNIFMYNKEDVDDRVSVELNMDRGSLEEVLDEICRQTPFKYEIIDEFVVITKKAPVIEQAVQQKKIIGKVTDKDGASLPGVSVVVKGTTIGVITDIDGNYVIETPEGAVLVFTFVGMKKKEFNVTAGVSEINVVLQNDVSLLGEVTVVSTGYQTMQKEKVTGSVVTIDAKDLETRSVTNVLDNLEGKVTGLVRYNGTTTIRGLGTMNANSDILVVVDGLPIEGSIEDINPYDVENVTILKDAAVAAIYGARASNGVIVITTKRVKGKEKIAVEFSCDLTINEKPDYSYMNYMTPSQQVDWESEYYNWWFSEGNETIENPITTFENDYIAQGTPITPIQYDYYQLAKGIISASQLNAQLADYKQNNFPQQFKDHALLNQVIQQYNLAIRTNNENAQTNLVLNYKTDNSGIINAFNRQLNIFLNGKYNVTKWLDVDYGVNIVTGKVRSHNDNFATDPFNVPSYLKLLNDDGSRAHYSTSRFNMYNPITETTPELYSLKFNHLDELERDFTNTSTLNMRYFGNLTFRVMSGLKFNTMFQYEDNRADVSSYSEAESYTMRWLQNVYTTRFGSEGDYSYTHLLPVGGKLATSQIKSTNYTARAQINYKKAFGKHVIDAIAGTEFRQTRVHGTRGALFGYDEQLQTQQITNMNFADLYNVTSTFLRPLGYSPRDLVYDKYISRAYGLNTDTRHRYASAYVNATYTYNQKYNFFASVRKDYADLFGGDKKYRGRPLWSLGSSWVASNEDFMSDVKFVNALKLRASYGVTGNIDAKTTSVLTAVTGINNDTQLVNASVINPPNSKLRWEKTTTTNIGLDFSLFDNRFRGSLDWYRRKGTDLFARKRLDPSEGFSSVVINNASMLNKGKELSLSYDWIRPVGRDSFAWSSTVTVTQNENKITYVDEVTTSPYSLASGDGFKTGYPVKALYSYQYAGLNDTGQPLWYKADGTLSETSLGSDDIDALVFSGGTEPKLNISFTNEFKYKNFSLSVFAVYYGGHFLRARPIPEPISYPLYRSMPSYVMNSWTPNNTDTDIPASGQYYKTANAVAQLDYSDFLVRPADFIKIRNIVLAYNLPSNIAAKIKASSVKLRFQINNPKTLWTKEDNIYVDPETQGLPIPTSYVFGLNVNF
ncbi:SusC/RagA family TonB-linked outer membrane protein [Labilibaculum filiforme]|nr:SusC/RagA family TonB-linked outer membrane protein [Labilibaculum filiforme]